MAKIDILVDNSSLTGGKRQEFIDMYLRNLLRNIPDLLEGEEIEQDFYESPPNRLVVCPEGGKASVNLVNHKDYLSWTDEERDRELQDSAFTVSVPQFAEEVVSKARRLRDCIDWENSNLNVSYESLKVSIENVEGSIENFER